METSNIFEAKVNNQIRVIQSVYENDGVVNIARISKDTHLDVKTVDSLWIEILNYIENNENLQKMDDYLSIRLRLLKDSWVYSLCENLLLGKEVSFVIFMEKHYLSESKLRRKIKYINQLLEPGALRIISRKGYLSIEGKETQIRYFAMQFFWTVFKGIKWPFEDVEFDHILSFVKERIFNTIEFTVKDVNHVEYAYAFTINLIRIRHGCTVSIAEIPYYSSDYVSYFKQPIYQKTKELLKTHFNLSKAERHYFLLTIQTRSQYYLVEEFYDQSIRAHQQNGTDVFKLYEQTMNYLDSKMSHPESRRFAEAIVLSAIMSAKMYDGFSRPSSGYGMKEFFEERAPHLLLNMEKLIDKITKKNQGLLMSNSKKEYLALRYAEAYSLTGNMLDFESKILVGVITDISFSLEELMVRKLRSRFYLIDNLEFVTLNQNEYDYFDLVIKTSITLGDISKEGEKIVVIDPTLNKKDVEQISEMIIKIREEKNKYLN